MNRAALGGFFVSLALIAAYLSADSPTCGQGQAPKTTTGEGDACNCLCPQFEYAVFDEYSSWLCQQCCPDGNYMARDYYSAISTLCPEGEEDPCPETCELLPEISTKAPPPTGAKAGVKGLTASSARPQPALLTALRPKGMNKPTMKDSKQNKLKAKSYVVSFPATAPAAQRLHAEVFEIDLLDGKRRVGTKPDKDFKFKGAGNKHTVFVGVEMEKGSGDNPIVADAVKPNGPKNYLVTFKVGMKDVEANIVTKNDTP